MHCRVPALAITLFAVVPNSGQAQVTTAVLQGRVFSGPDTVIAGATVEAQNRDTGLSRSARTDAVGSYRIPGLPVGPYEVTASASEFGTEVRSGLTLRIGQEATVDFTLIAAVDETITVTAEPPIIETTETDLSTTITTAQIDELPLLTRSFTELATLTPGIQDSATENSAISANGGSGSSNTFLKAAGKANWDKLDQVIARVETARAAGLRITADMYTYIAGATGLDAAMPPWVQEGGYDAWAGRLRDPEIRRRVAREMRTPTDAWENLYLAAGADGILLVAFQNPELRHLTGKTLVEVAAERGTTAEEAAMDLVVEDGSRVGTVYFLMSEANVGKQIALPWVAFGSDAASMAPVEPFTRASAHPRAYGNFARLLGRYVRERRVVPLAEAIRRLTSFPAATLGFEDRGRLAAGCFADIVVFDPDTIKDHATYEKPHRYSTGVLHVFVNGTQVLRDGEHTGATPGRLLRGPGWRGSEEETERAPR